MDNFLIHSSQWFEEKYLSMLSPEIRRVYTNVHTICVWTQNLCEHFSTNLSIQGRVGSLLLVHLKFLPDSSTSSTQQGVSTSHICEEANTVWRRWQWGRWTNVTCRTSASLHRHSTAYFATCGHTKHPLTITKRSALHILACQHSPRWLLDMTLRAGQLALRCAFEPISPQAQWV